MTNHSETIDRKGKPVLNEPAAQSVWDQVRWVLKPIASLRLTVVLFVLCMVLVLCGTLAQVDLSNDAAVRIYFRSIGLIWIPFQLFFPRDIKVPYSFPFPGGWLLGALLLVNLVAAHVTRFRVSWQRSGILMIHGGVLLLLFGELVTGLCQIEGNMDILEGSSANFVYHPDEVELAVIRPGHGGRDETVVVPEGLLRSGKPITHADLPFDVVVDEYMPNSSMVNVGLGSPIPSTPPQLLAAVAKGRPEVTGTTSEPEHDFPSANITLKRKGSDEVLGKYVVSVWLGHHQPPLARTVTVDGKTYDVIMRFKRTYKPYTIHLSEFHHEQYVGTTIPKDFKSDVLLVDPSKGENRRLAIWMNHPLRHAGEAFYQSSFRPDNRGTILMVVRNPGWLIPYCACAIVSLGMLVHFSATLQRFLKRTF